MKIKPNLSQTKQNHRKQKYPEKRNPSKLKISGHISGQNVETADQIHRNRDRTNNP